MRLSNRGFLSLEALHRSALQFMQESLNTNERQMFTDLYWELTVRTYIARLDYEGAWHRIQIAALGAKAFKGPFRICAGHVEGEPVGETASPNAIMNCVQILFHCLCRAGNVMAPDKIDIDPINDDWERLSGKGHPVASLLAQHRGLAFLNASILVEPIVFWANNYRRFASMPSETVST